jgi:hypothetical protein
MLERGELPLEGIKLVVDVYMFGSARAYSTEIRIPTKQIVKNIRRFTQHACRKRAILELRASPSSGSVDSTSSVWIWSSGSGVMF